MTRLVIATRNAHKVAEIRAILGAAFEYQTMADHPGAPAPVEDGSSFTENAAKKAGSLATWLREHGARDGWVLADDSGLEVDALGGAPGIHSARFAALDTGAPGNSRDADNNAQLLRLLNPVPADKRTARFRCVVALLPVAVETNGRSRIECFEGACEGRIERAPRGQGGFGYDPLFIPVGFNCSFAELGETEKNRISHRSRALAKANDWLRVQGVM